MIGNGGLTMKKVSIIIILVNAVILSGCQWQESSKQDISTSGEYETKIAVNSEEKDLEKPTLSKGEKIAKILGSTIWQGTKVYDKNNNDLTKENENFIGLAKYDDKSSRYEFYDKITKKSRGDFGTFYITNDGKFRVLISESKGTQSNVEFTEVADKKYTYKRIGKDANGNDVEVFVEHIPYTEGNLDFSETK